MTELAKKSEFDISIARRASYGFAQSESEAVTLVDKMVNSEILSEEVKLGLLRLVYGAYAAGVYEGILFATEEGPNNVDSLVSNHHRLMTRREHLVGSDELVRSRANEVLSILDCARMQATDNLDKAKEVNK